MQDLEILLDVAYSHVKLHANPKIVYNVKSVSDNFTIGAKSYHSQRIQISKRKIGLMYVAKNVIIQFFPFVILTILT